MLPIVQSPDPMLNQVCEDCEVGDEDLKALASQMIEAMYANRMKNGLVGYLKAKKELLKWASENLNL